VILTYSGKPSPFISEFDDSHYELIDESHRKTTDSRIKTRSGVQEYHKETIRENSFKEPDDEQSEQDGEGLFAILDSVGAEYIDRRPIGTLWLIDGPGIPELVGKLDARGFKFLFMANGSRASRHRPAYYLNSDGSDR
jgi:hypothetical protein